MNKTIMITGANSGLGKEAARQLALKKETEKIYLACRNEAKAQAAKESLEKETGREIFEIVIMDVTVPDSVRRAVADLVEPVDALIMNAGGMGGRDPGKLTADGVTQVFAVNVLGHVVLFDELVKAGKLKAVGLYAGSEAARGVKKMGIKRPSLKTHSPDEWASVIDGSFFGENFDGYQAYGYVKYAAAMWLASEARKHPDLRLVTVSPGGTKGTAVMEDLPPRLKFMFKYIMMPIVMPLRGLVHSLKTGAKRYVNALSSDDFKSGRFYGSKEPTVTGPLVDQGLIYSSLLNETFQNNANEAIHRFLPKAAIEPDAQVASE